VVAANLSNVVLLPRVAPTIFGVGAVISGTLFRFDPLRASGAATAVPARAAAQRATTVHAG
jgi:hypothetical protein